MPDTTEKPDPLAELVDRLRTVAAPAPGARPAGKPWEFGEAAAFLSITTKHLRYLADTGRVSTIRLGKRKRAISDAEMKRLCREGV
jgi:hypothetical protein